MGIFPKKVFKCIEQTFVLNKETNKKVQNQKNVTLENVKTNELQTQYASTFWNNVERAETALKRLEKEKEEETKAFEERIKEAEEQLKERERRISKIK